MPARRTRASKSKDDGPAVADAGREDGKVSQVSTLKSRCSAPGALSTRTRSSSRCIAPEDKVEDVKDGVSENRGTKRQRKSNHEVYEDGVCEPRSKRISAAHDSGYLSEPASSIASGSSAASVTSEICDASFLVASDLSLSEIESSPKVGYNRFLWNCCGGPSRDRISNVANELFTSIGWCDPEAVMKMIDEKERAYKDSRDPQMMKKHPELEPYMRAILMDWMIEVCEAHNLSRETYHLAVDYLDRFLSNWKNIRKNQLQLSGATALFIAAKLEEVTPPRAKEFAYVTDGACTPAEILMHEQVMLQVLKYKIYPLTGNAWMEFFLQIATKQSGRLHKELPIIPNALPMEIVELSRLLEFCIMDVRCHRFSYRYLAAACFYHAKSQDLALRVSGLPLEELSECIDFVKPFYAVAKKCPPAQCRFMEHYPIKTAFLLQNKNTSYSMVEQVWKDLTAKENKNYGYKCEKAVPRPARVAC